MEQTFKVGDRVRLIKCCEWMSDGYGLSNGACGTVDEDGSKAPFVNWDNGKRCACYDYRLELVEAPLSPLEDRIAALEARLAALEGTNEKAKEEAPQYTFGQPVEVYVYGAWKKGVITGPKKIGDTYWAVYLEADGIDASSDDFFHLKDIRPRTT